MVGVIQIMTIEEDQASTDVEQAHNADHKVAWVITVSLRISESSSTGTFCASVCASVRNLRVME